MTEYMQLVEEIKEILQNTAKDQDIVDGGDGKLIYSFTDEDAISASDDWGALGDESNLNIRTLFNNT